MQLQREAGGIACFGDVAKNIGQSGIGAVPFDERSALIAPLAAALVAADDYPSFGIGIECPCSDHAWDGSTR